MSLISSAESGTYFPSLSQTMDWAQIQSFMLGAEALAQSPQGANRRFAITKIYETPFIGTDYKVRLKYLPVLIDRDVEVRVRGRGMVDGFQRSFPSGEWVDVGSESYTVDGELGEIVFLDLPLFNESNKFRPASSYQSHGRLPGMPIEALQLSVSYYSGWDFAAADPPPEVEEIKAAIAMMTRVMASPPAQGVQSRSIEDIYKFSVSYSSSAAQLAVSGGASSPLDQWLSILKKFRPRETLR